MSVTDAGTVVTESTPFVHLRLHTEYSLCDSMVRIKPLMKAVTEAGQWAVGVTDASNVFALVKFYRAAMGAGVKPLAGAEVRVEMEQGHQTVLLYCRNRNGFRNLSCILTRIHMEGREDEDNPTAQFAWLEPYAEDLEWPSGDPARLEQVFANLISNALDAMREGGTLWVRVRPAQLPPSLLHQSPCPAVRVEVEDTGVGIPTRELQRIFEPFFTTRQDRTGLGLAIARRIVQDHRGSIEVQSEEMKGTRFTVTLPLPEQEPVGFDLPRASTDVRSPEESFGLRELG